MDSVSPSAGAVQRARLELPPGVTRQIVWRYAIPIAAIHALALLACLPSLFSWSGLVLCLVGVYTFGGLGINLCYHRILTHRSLKVPAWLERFFVLVALCCMEDAPGSWVATHRAHHKDSDERPDPHSPLVSFLWSHLGWLLVENRDIRSIDAFDRFARDILRTPFYMKLQRTLLPVWIYLAHLVLYFLAGFASGWIGGGSPQAGVQLGASWLVWGAILRTVIVWHITWSVNSLTHLFGYRTYPTPENSRNNWLVAVLGNGEGWHNNHHHDPSSASNWHRWWELDTIYLVIKVLKALGLATDIHLPRSRPGATA